MHRSVYIAATLLHLGLLLNVAAAAPRSRAVIAEFEIASDGDFIRLPVTIDREEYSFLLNTGMPTTTLDEAVLAKLALKKIAMEVRGGRRGQSPDRFGGLNATLGTLPLEFPAGVAAANYARIREKLDLDCQGEIGMDCLMQYIVQIDFDEGVLRLLSSVPAGSGEMIRITPLGGEGGAPTIPVSIPDVPSEKFIIFTGRAGNSLEIRSELLAQLVEKKKVNMLDKEKAVSRAGSLLFDTGRLEAVQVGKFRSEGVLINAAEQNGICLSYLARFLVTFDFPRHRVYLKKGANFDAPDCRLNLWNVEVARIEDRLVIQDVDHYGVAYRLGLRSGDVVESINGCDARRVSNWQARRLFGREGRPLAAVIRRGTQKLTLQTESAKAADPEEK